MKKAPSLISEIARRITVEMHRKHQEFASAAMPISSKNEELNSVNQIARLPMPNSGECIELMHPDCSGIDPPLAHWEEFTDGKFLVHGPGLPWVDWSMSATCIWTECGGIRHEIHQFSFPFSQDGGPPDGYQYFSNGVRVPKVFKMLSDAIKYVEEAVSAQYNFERKFFPWVLRLPAEDRALVLSCDCYLERIRLLQEKYSIDGNSWLARRDPPTSNCR
jgi:hypothetical protein